MLTAFCCSLNRRALSPCAVVILLAAVCGPGVLHAEDALDRLSEERLARVRADVHRLNAERKTHQRSGPYRDYRTNMHVHSLLSHDSRISLEEVVAAARRAGTDVLMFSEHPSDKIDFFSDGHQGVRDGVLLIPGAEMKGMLVYPRQSIRGLDGGSMAELSNLVRGRGGLTFLSHLEERMEVDVPGITGNEIYNTHFDFKTETRLIAAMKNPLWWIKGAELFQKYPQEALGALQDYPHEYLKRWDELCRSAPHTGVSANDAHQNVGMTIRISTSGRAIVEDALGEKVVEIDARLLRPFGLIPSEDNGEKVVFRALLDPYENSLKHVATHLLMREQTVGEVWEALESGRAYVSFDWLADATGFDFAIDADQRHEMGSRVDYVPEMKVVGRMPLAAHWKVMSDGRMLQEGQGNAFELTLPGPGNYRAEAWLEVGGYEQIWILSNPIYVK